MTRMIEECRHKDCILNTERCNPITVGLKLLYLLTAMVCTVGFQFKTAPELQFCIWNVVCLSTLKCQRAECKDNIIPSKSFTDLDKYHVSKQRLLALSDKIYILTQLNMYIYIFLLRSDFENLRVVMQTTNKQESFFFHQSTFNLFVVTDLWPKIKTYFPVQGKFHSSSMAPWEVFSESLTCVSFRSLL